MQEKSVIKRPHNIIMEGRKNLSISGVKDVGSFDEHIIVLYTDMGELTIKGVSLHIEKISIETGDVLVTGQVFGMMYTDEREKGSGFFGRIFK